MEQLEDMVRQGVESVAWWANKRGPVGWALTRLLTRLNAPLWRRWAARNPYEWGA